MKKPWWLKIALSVGITACLFGAVVQVIRISSREPVPLNVTAAAPVPENEYVGIQKCASCHTEQAEAHAKSGHARTFSDSRDAAISRRLDGRRFRDPDRGYEYVFGFQPEKGLTVSIPEKFGGLTFPLQYVFGSGRHAVSFLTLVSDPSGQVNGLEHRVTAFGSEEKLALTPGVRGSDPAIRVENFGKLIDHGKDVSQCIECHTANFKIHGAQLSELKPNVQCESCHGPGKRHVEAMQKGPPHSDLHIKTRWDSESQLQMCGSCHRWFDKAKDALPQKTDFKIVRFQPIGLSQSACYKKSNGKLNCKTCHDPHDAPSEDRPSYDLQCMKCHAATASSHATTESSVKACPVSPREKCVECHMPRIEVHKGFVFSDHWIRVRDAADLPAVTAPERSLPKKKN